jgi:hypothetical protein
MGSDAHGQAMNGYAARLIVALIGGRVALYSPLQKQSLRKKY